MSAFEGIADVSLNMDVRFAPKADSALMPLLVDRSLTFGTLRLVKLALGCCQVLLCLNHAVPDENAYNHEHHTRDPYPCWGRSYSFRHFFSPPFPFGPAMDASF